MSTPNETPSETRPPEGYETWLDYWLAEATAYNYGASTFARAELATLRSRCERAEERLWLVNLAYTDMLKVANIEADKVVALRAENERLRGLLELIARDTDDHGRPTVVTPPSATHRRHAMCECGCTMNDRRYRLPAPGKSFYLVKLSGACVDCDAPPGITIELVEPTHTLYRDYKRGDFETMPLKLEKWVDTKGVAIRTGMQQRQFVEAMAKHLVGLDSKEMGGGDGRIDDVGAETIAEEMYEDSTTVPTLVKDARP